MIDVVLDELASRGHLIGWFEVRNEEMLVEVDGTMRRYPEVFATVRQSTQ
jgi:hypothetical protein